MKCSVAKQLISTQLDGQISRLQLTKVQEHLLGCTECAGHYASSRRTIELVSSLGRKPVPPEVTLKIRVALSQELANRQSSRWEMVRVRWDNAFNAIMVPATAGLITTVIIFGVLIGMLYPRQVRAAGDVPTMLYTPAELQSTPFEMTIGAGNAESLVVEAYVGPDGRVEDYRVLSAPEDDSAVLPQLKNMLIFTTFHPATAFGQPTSSRVILSFSKVQVKG